MSAAAELRQQLARQLHAAPWLRWALLVAGVLAALLLCQWLESVRMQAQKDSIEEEVKLRRIRSLQGQDVWIVRQEEASRLHAALAAQIPEASTAGVAQASMQKWLGELANSVSDAQDVRITMDGATVLEQPPGLLRVRATLRGGMSGRSALHLVRRIEGAANLVVIDTVDIRSDTNRIVSIGMNAYYRLPAAETAP